ncbi:MAG TPA: DUF2892 domain-containing protein [Candidatus Desulfobacillus sp.]|nr:DUF2892 domain-containing protein [Candidatus Desulfobacillus sp.]
MTVNQLIRIFAGSFILGSLGLAHAGGHADLAQPSWLWFTAFVGANLLQSGFSKFCPLESLLVRLGVAKASPAGSCA